MWMVTLFPSNFIDFTVLHIVLMSNTFCFPAGAPLVPFGLKAARLFSPRCCVCTPALVSQDSCQSLLSGYFYPHLFTCHQEKVQRSFFLNAVVFPRLRTVPKMGHWSVSVGRLFDRSPKTTTQLSSFTSGSVRSTCFLFMIQNDDAALFLFPSAPSQCR